MYNEMSIVYLFIWKLNVQWNIYCLHQHLKSECTMKCQFWKLNVREISNVYLYIRNMITQGNVQCPSVYSKVECRIKCLMSICIFENKTLLECIINVQCLSVVVIRKLNSQCLVSMIYQFHYVQWNIPFLSVRLKSLCTMVCPTSMSTLENWMYYRNEILFFGFYQCVNSGESLTNWIKPRGLYVEFVNDSQEFTHR